MKVVLERAYKHLSNDKIMYFLINKFQDKIDWSNRYNSNYPLSIANLIIEQQISFKAAITVKKRFAKLLVYLKREKDVADIQKKISDEVNDKVNKYQREYFLREYYQIFVLSLN